MVVGPELPRAPSGAVGRVRANLAALRTLRELQAAQRQATDAEREVLAQWSAWGAVPSIFDTEDTRFASAREELKSLLSAQEYDAAALTTLNAHYTDPSYVQAIWAGVRALGFEHGAVLEPGCGSGTFLAHAPDEARMVGVELDRHNGGDRGGAVSACRCPRGVFRAQSIRERRL